MFPAGAVEAAEPMSMMAGSSCSSVAPAGTDQLDLEAAEQLIQLSGGDGGAAADGDDDAGSSESRSADSVKCRSNEKATAVESPRRNFAAGKDDDDGNGGGGGGETDVKSVVDSFAPCSTRAADDVVVETKDKVDAVAVAAAVESCCRRSESDQQRFPAAAKDHRDGGGGGVHGEKRKRSRFRSLASIYRDTEAMPVRRLTAGGGDGHAGRDRDPPEEERKEAEEKKRAAAEGGERRRRRRCRGGEQGRRDDRYS